MAIFSSSSKSASQISANGVGEVEFGCKILGGKGRMVATGILDASVGAEGTSTTAAIAALDNAFGEAGSELVAWADHTDAEPALQAVLPKRTKGG